MKKADNEKLFDQAKIYFSLTDEGKMKVLDYIRDIGSVEKYKRKDNTSITMYNQNSK